MRASRFTGLVFGGAVLALSASAASAITIEWKGAPEADAVLGENVVVDPVAVAMRRLIDEGMKQLGFEDKRDLAGIVAFYKERDFRPVWTAEGRLSPAARKLIFRLARADMDGLDPAAFQTSGLALGAHGPASPEDLATAELELDRAILRFAREAWGGRLDPTRISSNITITPGHPDPIAALADVAGAADPAASLDAFNPPHEGFKALKAKLAELRMSRGRPEVIRIPEGKALKLGLRDKRVALLRARFGIEPGEDPELFDEAVDTAVKAFQDKSGLTADGIIGRGTYAVLNADEGDRIGDVIANMERWRWVPRDLGRRYVAVNVPDFELKFISDGVIVHSTRVIVGQTDKQTPIFSDEMEHIIVNPYWNVPSSIATKEMLPKIQNDPEYFERRNYEIVQQVGKKTMVVDPASIDWSAVDPRNLPFRFRQPPGGGNALGHIKFMFPNKHSVYLHDTSSRGLFKRDYRALSHGCVRVDDPMAFADVVLAEEPDWDAARVKKMIGGAERNIPLSRHIPVHITYFTAYVDETGKLILKNDLYGHNARVKKALGLKS
ncbi:MAG TPA: L,D-transpeptidase family protein [Hyphomicrobiales bacterium]|nr:L,D-transpeptidase family protein [Kaistiaceae bacterium]HQF31083.1 L,D-transpeptidase family protein [Hyphomicrobiales bacterium]